MADRKTTRRTYRPARRVIYIGGREIRPISAVRIVTDDERVDAEDTTEKKIVVPSGRYDPKRFPTSEEYKQAFRKRWRALAS